MTDRTLKLPQSRKQYGFASAPLYTEQAQVKMLEALTWLPDPDAVLVKAGLSRYELRKLEGDDEITAASDTRREAVIATPWHLQRDGQPADDEGSLFIWEELQPWMELMTRAAWAAVPYGYSVWETVYADKSPRIGIGYISEKPFEWFKPHHRGVLRYFPIDSAPMGEGIVVDTEFKFFLTVREPTHRNPYGAALFSRLFWPWFFRKQGWQFWMQFLERWGTPFLVGHTASNTDAMAKALAKALKNATIAVGPEDKVEALTVTGTAHFEAFEKAVCARIQKVILGQTLTTDVGGSSSSSVGSFALGKVHNEVREDRRNADIRLVGKSIQRQVDALWKLNRFSGPAPEVIFQDDTGLQLDRAERDAKLLATGAVKLTKDYYERVYDFEPGEVEIPATVVPPGGTPADGSGDTGGAAPSAKGGVAAAAKPAPRFTREQQAIEDLIANASKQLSAPVNPDDIKAAIKAARDPDDLAHRLAILFQSADVQGFAEVLERCLFAADVMGYAHAQTPVVPAKKDEALAELATRFEKVEGAVERMGAEPREQHVHVHQGETIVENTVAVPESPVHAHFHAPEPRAITKTITGPDGKPIGTVREEPE